MYKQQDRRGRIKKAIDRLMRMFRPEPEPPEDPYAMVGAPKKPRPPLRSSAVSEPLD